MKSLTDGKLRQAMELRVATYTMMRVAFGFLFAFHGAQKLFGAFGGNQATDWKYWVAGSIEFFGGLGVAIGLFTQVAALGCCILMLVAYFYAHAPQGVLPIQNKGELALVYLFGFLYIAARGGSKWSVDGRNRDADELD